MPGFPFREGRDPVTDMPGFPSGRGDIRHRQARVSSGRVDGYQTQTGKGFPSGRRDTRHRQIRVSLQERGISDTGRSGFPFRKGFYRRQTGQGFPLGKGGFRRQTGQGLGKVIYRRQIGQDFLSGRGDTRLVMSKQ
jgi:hypothetical protein